MNSGNLPDSDEILFEVNGRLITKEVAIDVRAETASASIFIPDYEQEE